LKGKKLHGKRNHINKFLSKYPDYEYRRLDKSMIADCIALYDHWMDEKTGEVTVLSAGQTDITASYAGDGYFLDSTASYTLTVEKKTIKLDFGKLEKEYGQDDPDLAPVVRNVVDAGLLEADKGLLDTICGYITATYEGTDTENDPKGNDREPGTYDVELTVSDEAKTIANYGLEICKNTLHVKDIRPTEEKNYTVSGI